ncbi:response regulator [bacterium]|nr:response regulator [bacterium]
MSDKKVLTTGQVAEYCGVNFRTVIRWIAKGHLKSYKLPGRGDNRVEVVHFLSFLKENRIPIPDDFKNNSKKILVVEDTPEMANSIARTLKRKGFEVEIASDGLRAGVLLGTFKPNIMTLDLAMPGLDGMGVLEYVKSNEDLVLVKILVISALETDILKSTIEKGADDYLQKPFEAADLTKAIDQLMDN